MNPTTTRPPGVERNAAPLLHGTEAVALGAVLPSGQWGHGPATDQFEADVADLLGVTDTVAVNSGTTALHLALRSIGIGPGDDVVLPSLTFCASVQAITWNGAAPRFAEIDPRTLAVTPDTVLEALTPNTRAVMPVLYGGRAVDLAPIRDHLAGRGIQIIEDAAHAFGSRYPNGTMVGADPAVLTCFSHDPIKNLTTGQGGTIVPRTREEAAALRSLRLFGIVQSKDARASLTSYEVQGAGMRFDMSQLNAAIGLAQLQHFPQTAAHRQHLWRTFQAELTGLEGARLVDVDVTNTVPFNCVVVLDHHRDDVFRHLREHGIGVAVHYPPNHTQAAFLPWHRDLPVTEQVASQILGLPFHPAMTHDSVRYTVAALADAIKATS
ncbi:DegT/DnrJ/EryC1/StrS family aminotransferase [Kitasatospora aureofaciens]|uniref:DegT/DnrJ/EryC1/StrS family aminotransferase n=1 Tax=Kitasatospora aureofaciens TaxID=1894 RepID=UPI00092868CE|nr:DegT/DnrJ/EryC1/StrS family aminotransferase [Streptomyces viridifaciens]UKZ04808.1 DegT/DnrJ/EryC1/StrS family aminotransferase [Streptomyces viridifaciens]